MAKKPKIAQCKGCGKSFEKHYQMAYCSVQCRKAYWSKKMDAVENHCPTCGTLFKTTGTRKYCSSKCTKTYIKQHAVKTEKTCICGTKFMGTKHKKYCKPSCQSKLRAYTYVKRPKTAICEICHREFTAYSNTTLVCHKPDCTSGLYKGNVGITQTYKNDGRSPSEIVLSPKVDETRDYLFDFFKTMNTELQRTTFEQIKTAFLSGNHPRAKHRVAIAAALFYLASRGAMKIMWIEAALRKRKERKESASQLTIRTYISMVLEDKMIANVVEALPRSTYKRVFVSSDATKPDDGRLRHATGIRVKYHDRVETATINFPNKVLQALFGWKGRLDGDGYTKRRCVIHFEIDEPTGEVRMTKKELPEPAEPPVMVRKSPNVVKREAIENARMYRAMSGVSASTGDSNAGFFIDGKGDVKEAVLQKIDNFSPDHEFPGIEGVVLAYNSMYCPFCTVCRLTLGNKKRALTHARSKHGDILNRVKDDIAAKKNGKGSETGKHEEGTKPAEQTIT